MPEKLPPLIVHIIFRLDYGGLENGLINILNGMPQHEFRHAIVCLAGYGDFRHRLRRGDVNLYTLDKRPGKDLGAYVRLARLLRMLKPAIVHTRNLGTVDLQWIAWLSGVRRRVHGEHGWDAADPQGSNPKQLLIRKMCRPAIQRYVAMSKDLAMWLQARVNVPAARIRQIYNGVDTLRFTPAGQAPSDMPWNPVGADKPFVFGTVGRLDRVKNQVALLDAFAALVAEHPQTRTQLRLMIVGGGPLSEELQAKAGALGIAELVWFSGARNDVPALMRTMNVFVLPSLNEGISNTLLEAMASGLPVIAAEVGGNPELIKVDETGLLYDPADAQGLLNALRHYYRRPELSRQSGAAGRAHVLKGFSLDSMINNYLQLYRELMV